MWLPVSCQKINFWAGFLLLVFAHSVYAVAQYDIIDLGTLGGTISSAFGINDAGQVVGTSTLPGDTESHAVLFDGSDLLDLGTLGGTGAAGFDINIKGQIVGTSSLPGNQVRHAFLHDGSAVIDLGTLGGENSYAYAINDYGQVVGFSYLKDFSGRGFLYDGATMIDLSTLGATGYAYDINNDGHIVGQGPQNHAFLFDGTAMTDLGTLGGTKSIATAINDNGWVVGLSDSYDGIYDIDHAFLYDGSAMIDLATPNGDNLGISLANDINNSRQIVGKSTTDGFEEHAFLYDSLFGMVDLNQLISPESGWLLLEATCINNAGQIAGNGLLNGQDRAFLLDPVPEPSAALLLGLGGLALRYRKQLQ